MGERPITLGVIPGRATGIRTARDLMRGARGRTRR